MIKIQTVQPFATYSSKKSVGFSDFPNSVKAAHEKINSKISQFQMDEQIARMRRGSKDDYVYLYEIIKVNVKKKTQRRNKLLHKVTKLTNAKLFKRVLLQLNCFVSNAKMLRPASNTIDTLKLR